MNLIEKEVLEILNRINNNSNKSTETTYLELLAKLGMSKRKSSKKLGQFDAALKKNEISIWSGERLLYRISDFNKSQTVTFKILKSEEILNSMGRERFAVTPEEIVENKKQLSKSKLKAKITKTAKNQNAGTLTVSSSESS